MSRPPHATRPFKLGAHAHSAHCDCGGHEQQRHEQGEPRAGRWATVLPAIACLVCPACLSVYAKVFAALGVGVVISERTHGWLLAIAVVLSLATGLWRARRSARWKSFSVTVLGSVAVVLGHLSARHALEWAGVALLLLSGLSERSSARATSTTATAAR